MNRKEIGVKIEALRKERKISQYRLAMEAGLSVSYIHDLEKGLKCPTVEALDSICYALQTTLSEFFSKPNQDIGFSRLEKLNERQKKLLNDFLDSLL